MAAPLSRQAIDACVFDAYGTLLDTAAAAARCRDVLGERAETLTRVWRQKQLEHTWLRSLRGDYVDFWHVTGESLDYAMAACGVADVALRARLMEAYFILDAYADAKDTLAVIKAAGLKTAILSNGSPSMLTGAVRSGELWELLDEVISVDPAQIYKPHPSVYQLACDRLHAPAERLCFVSGNGWDASGAAHFGLRVIWLNRTGATPETLPGRPEREIRSLAELPAALGL